jgi:hypothetical protein
VLIRREATKLVDFEEWKRNLEIDDDIILPSQPPTVIIPFLHLSFGEIAHVFRSRKKT